MVEREHQLMQTSIMNDTYRHKPLARHKQFDIFIVQMAFVTLWSDLFPFLSHCEAMQAGSEGTYHAPPIHFDETLLSFKRYMALAHV